MLYLEKNKEHLINETTRLLSYLHAGKIGPIKTKTTMIKKSAIELIELNAKKKLDNDYQLLCKNILDICNIIYNNTVLEIIEDGVYDMLLEVYHRYRNIPIGAPPISFKDIHELNSLIADNKVKNESSSTIPYVMLNNENFFSRDMHKSYNTLALQQQKLSASVPYDNKVDDELDKRMSKRLNVNEHKYPELAGTLRKCKFVYDQQAKEKGVLNDPTTTTVEQWFASLIKSGIMNPNKEYEMVLEFKYDGISINGEANSVLQTAYTRGDVENNKTSDLTPLLGGYTFYNSLGMIPDKNIMGMQFECIITNEDLLEFNKRKGVEYKNNRTAIVGLLGSSDAYLYRDLITLVPLKIVPIENGEKIDVDRYTELELLDKVYSTKVRPVYTLINGTYDRLLWMINQFCKEGEVFRDVIPYMYDGVVVSFVDSKIINSLGRKNNINQYQMAIKFPSMTKQTIFRGYTYEIGADGRVTPMAHYDPIEFFGTIHTKSSVHSYGRFKILNLSIGQRIEVEYTNDVIPYVKGSVDDVDVEPEEFITKCPYCNSRLVDSNKAKYCTVFDCSARAISRMSNTVKALGLKGISSETIRILHIKSFKSLMTIDRDKIANIIGPEVANNIMLEIDRFKNNPIYDFIIMGALGFKDTATSKWKLILSKYSIKEVSQFKDNQFIQQLSNIKGIGSATVEVVRNEMKYFKEDIDYILKNLEVINSKNIYSLKIRFTGVRDRELEMKLTSMGHDASEGSVTKDTDMLVVPSLQHESFKTKKASQYNIRIMTIRQLVNEMKINL